MSRLTFGLRPSPFVATSVLRFHAEKYLTNHPAAAQAIMQSFYVDDFISGATTEDEAVMLQQTLCQVLQEAGMNLRKWRSSSQTVLDSIPAELKETNPIQELLGENAQKALGIHWHTKEDAFYISTPTLDSTDHVTKRMVARGVASLYDVMGLIAPYHMTGKIILQSLWAEGIKWDEDIPSEKLVQWQQWLSQLKTISKLPIQRFVGGVTEHTHLNGFSDSSNKAYAAVIYMCSGSQQPQLVWCKARVSPLKQRTLPEMELEAARLLAMALAHLSTTLEVPLLRCSAWTDSEIVLAWMQKPLHKLTTFVANRVAAIYETIPGVSWRHVGTEDNPADLPSRGMAAEELVTSQLWWHGPP